MEYYIITTKACNLGCVYCYRNRDPRESSKPTEQLILDAAKYIVSQPHTEKKVTFHGGEPLLAQDVIKKMISSMEGQGIQYVLYSNGTLLETVDPWILENLDYLTISIDGEQKVHDRYRGSGTFSTIMNNLSKIRKKFKGHIIGRMTLVIDNDVSLWKGVSEILKSGYFDSVTWQLENTAEIYEENYLAKFIKSYDDDTSELIDYWVKGVSKGNILNILPIQGAFKSIILNEKEDNFICGCGSDLVFIDLTNGGKCYACDELIDSNKFELGDIYKGISFPTNLKPAKLNKECSLCDIIHICRGRCLRSCLTFPEERFRFYCKTVNILIRKAESVLPDIKRLIDDGTISLEKICCSALDLIEGIP